MDEASPQLSLSVNKMIKCGDVMRKFSGIRSHGFHTEKNLI